MAHLFISAAHKSSGKTTLAMGLCAALQQRGLKVQPFKKGPDYIDPMWLTAAAGRPCYNLDFFTMGSREIARLFSQHAQHADIAVIEGNKGLYDGLDLEGGNSNAALAMLFNAPVVLVIDARGMTRGIAPLLLGYQAFEPDINIAGVILNQLGGKRHEAKLRAVIERYTDIKVFGGVQRDEALHIDERHLGLIPSNELAVADQRLALISTMLSEQIDLDGLLSIAKAATVQAAPVADTQRRHKVDLRVGIARDRAFGFYYADDMEALEREGAQLEFFDTLHDAQLPEVDALFIGGGFPETHMPQLELNSPLRGAIRNAIDDGLPVYAECGGLMYLARSIQWRGRCHAMVGAIPADVVMHERPQGRGYVRLQQTGHALWPDEVPLREIAGHEFHHSTLTNIGSDVQFAYKVLRGTGIDGSNDGIVYRNVLASYAHQRDTESNHWTQRFLSFVRACKDAAQSGNAH